MSPFYDNPEYKKASAAFNKLWPMIDDPNMNWITTLGIIKTEDEYCISLRVRERNPELEEKYQSIDGVKIIYEQASEREIEIVDSIDED